MAESGKSVETLKDLRAIARWIDRRTRMQWLLLVPVVSLAAAVEALAALAVFGLLRLVVAPDHVRTAPVVSRIWRAWPSDDPPAIVAALTIGVAVLYVARALFLSWAEWVKESVIHRSGVRAAERLFARYLAAEYVFHLRRRSSSLIAEISRSTDAAFQLIAASVLNIVAEVATVAALVIVVLVMAPARTIAAVALVLAFIAVPVITTRRFWLRLGERHKKLEEQQLHVLQQSLGAIKEVKIAGREAFFEARFRATRRAIARVRQQRAWASSGLRLMVETILIVAMLLVILIVTMRGTSSADTVAVLALFAYTGFRVVPSANRLMLNAGYLREGRPFARAVAKDFDALGEAARAASLEPPLAFDDSLRCDAVSFAYEPDARPAIAGVNIRIRRGESVGIVGPTGSGKSTLVDVLLGLLRPTSGRVLIDEHDLTGCERAWQRLVGYVPQDPYLLDDTLRRNVAFGVPDSVIEDQRVARACTLAQLDEVIRQLPDGLDTVIGEEGIRLSGGQRQRVAIARALYHEPAVLVFDEATAALDNQTEREVTRAIASLHGTRTMIVIAHRLSTVQGCDRLIFLRDGRVAAVGSYDELMANDAFRELATGTRSRT